MSSWKAIASGAAGAVVLTVLNEGARRVDPEAPRLDVLGMRAIAKALRGAGQTPPDAPDLHNLSLIGDLFSNTAYYSLAALPSERGAWARGAGLGLAAGLGAVFLPPILGLGEKPSARTTRTAVMSVLWYLAGGLTAAGVRHALGKDE